MSRNCFLLVVGYDVYLVGGCVRDLILKQTPKDFDVITSAELKEVTNLRSTGQLRRLSWVNKTQLQLTRGYSHAYAVIWICIKGWYLVRLHDKYWLNLQVMKVFSWCKIVGKRFPICHVHMDDTIVEVGRFCLTLKNFSFGLNFLYNNVCLFFFWSPVFLVLLFMVIILSPAQLGGKF